MRLNDDNYDESRDDSEEDIEFCPFCNSINFPAQDQTCYHFLALYSDGELHWGGYELGKLTDTIRSFRDFLQDNDHLNDVIDNEKQNQFLTERQRNFCTILGPESYDDNLDVLLDICGDSIKEGGLRKTDTFLSSGGGSTYYIERHELLSSIEEELNILKDLLVKSAG
jgi:hypothetical protein